MQLFRKGSTRVLVATDILARGIDVPSGLRILNYDTPEAPEQYVHRSGRTGRYFGSGLAVTFVTPDESSDFALTERKLLQTNQLGLTEVSQECL